jgi:hypothetical protein
MQNSKNVMEWTFLQVPCPQCQRIPTATQILVTTTIYIYIYVYMYIYMYIHTYIHMRVPTATQHPRQH